VPDRHPHRATPQKRIILLEARDEQGNVLASTGGSWNQHQVWRMYDFGNFKSVDLKLAVHRSIFLEYLIRPKLDGECE